VHPSKVSTPANHIAMGSITHKLLVKQLAAIAYLKILSFHLLFSLKSEVKKIHFFYFRNRVFNHT